jgi:CP family cyanate transporter-like MFS transporter
MVRMEERLHRAAVASGWRAALAAILIVLAGFNLRSVILGVPPVLPLISQDLALDHTTTGLVTALPVLIFGALAVPSGLVAGRLGGRRGVTIGLVLLAAGAALRAVWAAALPLLFFTALLSLGIALAQTAMPVLVRQWFPTHVGLAAALFTDGLIIGEAVAAGVTVPLMSAFLGHDNWEGSFILWSLPVVMVLALWVTLAPPGPPMAPHQVTAERAAATDAGGDPPRRVSVAHMGVLLGSGSLVYFGMNAWIANYNQALGLATLTPAALATLNAAQLPVSLGVTATAQRIAGRGGPFMVGGAVCTAALAGWVFGPSALEPLWAALLGGGSSLVFVLGIALPPLLAQHHEVARLTGMTLGISYTFAFLGPLLGGALWDLLPRLPAVVFVPVAVAAVLQFALGAQLARLGVRAPVANPAHLPSA